MLPVVGGAGNKAGHLVFHAIACCFELDASFAFDVLCLIPTSEQVFAGLEVRDLEEFRAATDGGCGAGGILSCACDCGIDCEVDLVAVDFGNPFVGQTFVIYVLEGWVLEDVNLLGFWLRS